MENKTHFMTEIPKRNHSVSSIFMAHAKEQLHILVKKIWADLLPAVLIPLAAR